MIELSHVDNAASIENLDEIHVNDVPKCKSDTISTTTSETSQEGLEIRKVIEEETSEIGSVCTFFVYLFIFHK